MKKVLLYTWGMVALLGCGRQEVDPISALSCGRMNLAANGVAAVNTDFRNTLLLVNDNGQRGRRMDIRTDIDGGTFILSVKNWDWQLPPTDAILGKTYKIQDPASACQEVDGVFYCEGVLGTFLKGDKFYASVTEKAGGHIQITKIDGVTKKMSGTFTVKMIYMQDTARVKETVSFTGNFENLCYEVLR